MNIRKALTTTIILSLITLFVVAEVFAAAQTLCPVMGGTINKDIHEDYKGKRVYFCCAACPPQFVQDPEKYMKKLKEMGQEPEQLKGK